MTIFNSIYEIITTHIIPITVPYGELCASLASTGLCFWFISLAFYPVKWLADMMFSMWR